MNHSGFMQEAVKEAMRGIKANHGNPFGAVIVKNGKIIARGHNMVLKENDPTAHAEIIAIRNAAKKSNNRHLFDCTIYSSCEPCPMCLCAIYWARIKKVYYGCTKKDAAKIGFEDLLFHEVLKEYSEKKLAFSKQIMRNNCLAPFKEWQKKLDKKTVLNFQFFFVKSFSFHRTSEKPCNPKIFRICSRATAFPICN